MQAEIILPLLYFWMKDSPVSFSSKLKNSKWNIGFTFLGFFVVFFLIKKFSQVSAQKLQVFQYTVLGTPAVALSPNYMQNFDLD